MLLFEHKGISRRGKHPVVWDPAYRDVWTPKLLRSGDLRPFVTYGEMVLPGERATLRLFRRRAETTFDLFDPCAPSRRFKFGCRSGPP